MFKTRRYTHFAEQARGFRITHPQLATFILYHPQPTHPPPPQHSTMASSRPSFVCKSCARAFSKPAPTTTATRTFTTSPVQHQLPSPDLPRWQQTPPAMAMPVRLRPKPNQPLWRVNTRQEPLDEMYDRFVGRVGEAAKGQDGLVGTRGRELLGEDVKVRRNVFEILRRLRCEIGVLRLEKLTYGVIYNSG